MPNLVAVFYQINDALGRAFLSLWGQNPLKGIELNSVPTHAAS